MSEDREVKARLLWKHEKGIVSVLKDTIAENARLKAMLDYNIMMGNIEDPDEEEGEEDE